MPNKPVIILLLYHGKGHFNACFKLARILGETYRVVFSGVEFFRSHVVEQGFEYFSLRTVPFGIGLEDWMNTIEKKKYPYLNTVRDRFNDRLYKIREQELKFLVDTLKPVHILLDVQQSTDFIVLFPIVTSISLIHTMLPSRLTDNIPPINSVALPGNPREIRKAHKKVRFDKLKRQWLQRLKYFWMDDILIINRRIKRNQIPALFISNQRSLFRFNVKEIDEFILAPREFDFPEINHNSFQNFVGSLVDHERIEKVDAEYLLQSREIYQLVESGNQKLIYCSLGTLAPENRQATLSFFNRLFQVTADNENYTLIVSFPFSENEKQQLNKNHDRIFLFNSVPQLSVLSKADLFITHGGLNSIKESINAVVPMLVYPIDSNYDQNGNSGRVVYHGLGLRGDLSKDTSAEMEEKINKLLTDLEFRKNLERMKATDHKYSAEKLLSRIGFRSSDRVAE